MTQSITRKLFRAATLALATACTLAAVVALSGYLYQDPIPAYAQAVPPAAWTAVGATGAVDESSLTRFAFTNASAGYATTTPSVDPLEFRFNVTNTYDNGANPNVPGWTSMQLGGQAPGTSFVTAQLYQVDPCTGAQKLICQDRIVQAPNGTCVKCTFTATTVDFGRANYYVRVLMDRATPSENPLLHGLRIQ